MTDQIDIIGDVHGHASTLEALLKSMGYRVQGGAWKHPERHVIFVGDLIDSGPEQMRSLRLVRSMVDAGSAVALMGNHEFNAICWWTEDPHHPGDYLRSRHSAQWGEGNRKQHEAFLVEFEAYPDFHREAVEWFLTLPLWFETGGLRVVHACWDANAIQLLKERLGDAGTLPSSLVPEASDTASTFGAAVERVLKGQEIEMPDGLFLTDRYGIRRNHFRRKWWDGNADTYRASALLPSAEADQLPEQPLPGYAMLAVDRSPPTLFGHYCLKGESGYLAPNFFCVDTCVAKNGRLSAYRWSGEAILSGANLVSVPA